ncbi:hypothetical protein ID866_4649 [Astraeus odoratus]|nr:hypothetical protein ID866_4649 [Astraeus odoratus]
MLGRLNNLRTALLSFVPLGAPKKSVDISHYRSAMSSTAQDPEVATFAAGCFWGVEHIFLKHYPPSENKGILKTAVGYTGGKKADPSYREVCSGTTGHAEAVRIEFDPSVVSYAELVEFFYRTHDPTAVNRQGPDIGTQYRSAIFTHNREQQATAQRVTEEVQEKHFTPKGQRIATEILDAGEWYNAEDYHQLIPDDSPVHAFLTKCDPWVEIYVTHVETSNLRHRHSKARGRFLTLLAVNLLFSFLLVRRIYGGLYRYGILFLASKIVPMSNTLAFRMDTALIGNFLLDLFIFSILLPIVLDFAKGIATLRLRYGFPQEEIIFRKLTPSAIATIAAATPEKKDKLLKDLLTRAVDPEEMKQIAFGMPWEEWAYDYHAMAAAHKASKEDVVSPKTWELSVWMKMGERWTVIQHGREEDYTTQVGMMEKLRDKLDEMGKLHVFQQMMEVIQVKTMSQAGTPLPVTDEVNGIVADIFKRNDIDFAKLMGQIAMDTPPSFQRGSKKDD